MVDKRSRSRLVVLALPLAVLAVVGLGLFFALTRPGGEEPTDAGAAESEQAVEREAARLEAEFAERDRRQIGELTEVARRTSEDLNPVLDEMSASLPPGGEPVEDELASAGEVEAWKEALDAADREFGDPPSGETATNVARGSLEAAVDALRGAALAYEDALDLPVGEDRRQALARAAEGRDLGVKVWSIGATQLDYVNVEAGFGHQHVYLSASGVEGALQADPAPEGSEAHEAHEDHAGE